MISRYIVCNNSKLTLMAEKVSQSNVRETFYPNGKKAYYCEYDSDGKEHGVERVWESTGELCQENHWCHGELHGLSTRWNWNPSVFKGDHHLQSRTDYNHGKQDGLHEEWYPTGQMKIRISSSDDQRHGLYEEWYPNTQLKERKEYVLGKLNGLHEKWYPDGQDKSRKNYVLGRLQ